MSWEVRRGDHLAKETGKQRTKKGRGGVRRKKRTGRRGGGGGRSEEKETKRESNKLESEVAASGMQRRADAGAQAPRQREGERKQSRGHLRQRDAALNARSSP
eukprot:755482-Hanusia_phi.AAC.6